MKVALARGGLAIGVALASAGMAHAQVSINVNSSFPSDIQGGAPSATLQQAATFAWQEFIALNWPALSGQRDTADNNQKFGGGNGGPLVWQTFRSKVEIFNIINDAPPGYSASAPDLGYNTAPTDYYYRGRTVPNCPTQTVPTSPAWINLDETTQIELDQMFAGGPAITGTSNTLPQLIRFAVKANHVEYEYIADPKNQYYIPDNALPARTNNIKAYTANPPVAPTPPFISFPAGTVEIKSAWRPLNSNDNPAHFHTQTVRFYENSGDNGNGPACYYEQQWGLIALHIIQKTPTAPAFIYATFEQAENIRQPNGTPVEDADGNIVNPISGAAPTTPAMTYMDSPTAPKVSISGVCTPNFNLYFKDNAKDPGLTGGGALCVNQRYEPIPSDVIAVNQAAHQAITAYDTAQGVTNSPWPFYKLVSVQPQPFDVTTISPTDPVHGAAVFFQANIVVETNYTLQQFQGRIATSAGGAGAPTAVVSPGVPPPNVVTPNGSGTGTSAPSGIGPAPSVVGVNMGGCMGCHGNAQVSKGSDFSFILAEGPTPAPETPSVLDGGASAAQREESAALREKYLNLFVPRK
jgi:hypothetical protein